MIGSSLLRYQDNQQYVIWDLETESLNLYHSRPWQISYGIGDLKGIKQHHVRYIWWEDLNISDEAARITRFNYEHYKANAEPAEAVLGDFEAFLLSPEYILGGHNLLGFDIYQLENWRRACGHKTDWSYKDRIIDTLCLSKAYRSNIKPSGDRLTWQYKLLDFWVSKKKASKEETPEEKKRRGGTSLGAMCREFKIDYDESRAHDAQYDTEVNHKLLNRLIWSVEI